AVERLVLRQAKERLDLIVWGYSAPSSTIDIYSLVDFDTEVLAVEKDRMLVFQYGTARLDLNSQALTAFKRQTGSFHFTLYVDKERAKETYFAFARRTITITVVIFALCFILFGVFLLRNMVDPLSELARTMVSLTSQNLRIRLPLPKRKDEIGQLIHAFNRMMEEISTAYEKRLEYVEDVIHDIVTPVQILEGYRQLIERHGRKREWVDEFLEVSKVELSKLRDMALSLKETQQAERKKSIPSAQAAQITQRIVQAYEELHPSIAFHRDIAPEVILPIDPLDLERIVHILLDNAVKYGGREVWIRLGKDELSVEDRGPGIEWEERERIFQRYYRSNKVLPSTRGAGIGLSILKRFSEEYGFQIQVGNVHPSGCVFRILFSGESLK
ncbi:MAG: HAMP domain-containing histidine kinase, partial [Spirochaetes bacterium]|nr:HAMP domain-containing histidine kinase [Spirochaetota bacterium]